MPAMAQQWYDHGGVVWKVFALNGRTWLQQRPSLADAATLRQRWAERHPGAAPVDAVPFNNADDLGAALAGRRGDGGDGAPAAPPQAVLTAVADAIRQHMGFSLFGFDVLGAVPAKQWIVCDVNYFPGYGGVPDAHAQLLAHIASQLERCGGVALH